MAPPVRVSQSWRGAPAVALGRPVPDVFASSHTIASGGSSAPITSAQLPRVSSPDGSSGRSAGVRWGSTPAATSSATASSAAAMSSAPVASTCTCVPSGTRSLGLPG
jgi:hypothetical protein